jgi:rSAM/selenodomain-associated transferase 1
VPPTRLIVFLRAPRPGFVKTRLAAALGPDSACAAYRRLIEHLLPALRESSLPVELRFTPDDAAGEVSRWLDPGWTLSPQGEGDLGDRLFRAVAESQAAGVERTLVIGTDCPYLISQDLQQAATALADADLVLGPAQDGGYWLIGLRRPIATLFEGIPWSTDRVLAVTKERAQSEGLVVRQLRCLADVDTPEDYRRFLDQPGRG